MSEDPSHQTWPLQNHWEGGKVRLQPPTLGQEEHNRSHDGQGKDQGRRHNNTAARSRQCAFDHDQWRKTETQLRRMQIDQPGNEIHLAGFLFEPSTGLTVQLQATHPPLP
eukprot:EG_transcript_59920